MFTSPHLVSVTERVQIDGIDISEHEFAKLATRVRDVSERLTATGVLENVPTFFEQVTAIALLAFAEAEVQLAILETGLGGRFDAVTAGNAEIAAITRIDLDHQQYLGESIEEIAAEKAAIIRRDSIVCVGKQTAAARDVILEKCRSVNVSPHTLEYASFGPENEGAGFNMNEFQVGEVMLSLPGEHQIENAALAVLISKQLRPRLAIAKDQIISGLERATHPGRLEYFEAGGIKILLDGAHNPSGVDALAAHLNKHHRGFEVVLVFGAMEGKDISGMLNKLIPLAKDLILTKPKNTRSIEPATVFKENNAIGVHRFVVDEVEQAIDSAVQIARTYPESSLPLVVVTGSLYLVGEARQLLTRSGK
jgi:dihydrofolate synthase/folylpolyglutamate synthase